MLLAKQNDNYSAADLKVALKKKCIDFKGFHFNVTFSQAVLVVQMLL